MIYYPIDTDFFSVQLMWTKYFYFCSPHFHTLFIWYDRLSIFHNILLSFYPNLHVY